MLSTKRIICDYKGDNNGPLLICFAAIHGNEIAGVRALETMKTMLLAEEKLNPGFQFFGRIVGLMGNINAYQNNKRFIKCDLNRHFKKEHVDSLLLADKSQLQAEDFELRALIDTVNDLIKEQSPSKVYILDLHTTSSKEGIFCIPTNDDESINICVHMHAPVILGLLEGLEGTSMHYFNSENLHVPTTALTFESGHHEDIQSVYRSISGIISVLRTIGCIDAKDVESRHDQILINYAKQFPKLTMVKERHGISPADHFKMRPNYSNFQALSKGEVIADDIHGEISVDEDCLILMPLYQEQGEDGFYLVKEVI